MAERRFRLRDVIFLKIHGFSLCLKPSSIGAGTGVFVDRGSIPAANYPVALYPGTVYLPGDPIFFQSLGNPFIFRCADGTLVDGSHRALSKVIHRSCVLRERQGNELNSEGDYPVVLRSCVLRERQGNELNSEGDYPVVLRSCVLRERQGNELNSEGDYPVFLRSCVLRERQGNELNSDSSWLDPPNALNPLAVGQIVNNQEEDKKKEDSESQDFITPKRDYLLF
ncbi:unnamed protein product [Cyprideis torosa]|uniref:Uncharacterized protein n=1 Tax=Cyprideis torosa TaxID=163714 RepID=A0A7R8WCQ1_9CRUS|nr:unnamed protein product [Cyprideis torosa]CAG0893758.1 unnamed protein product [Cyprideis torosa]